MTIKIAAVNVGIITERRGEAAEAMQRKTINKKPNGTGEKRDMKSVELNEEDALDRTKCKNDIQNHSDDPRY